MTTLNLFERYLQIFAASFRYNWDVGRIWAVTYTSYHMNEQCICTMALSSSKVEISTFQFSLKSRNF